MSNKVETLRARHRIFSALRGFFDGRGFVEIHTPMLVPNPGLEPHLVPFATELVRGMENRESRTLYLPTSPEYHLKKALALGFDRVYEITRSFRNGELGPEHEPEFFMIEWYRAPGSYREIARDVEALVAELGATFAPAEAKWGKSIHLSVEEAFTRYAGISLRSALSGGETLNAQARRLGLASIAEEDDFDTAFHSILVEKIEPRLGFEGLTFLWDYPSSQAALSRIKANDSHFAERFEVYWRGIELANAFQELTDSTEQRERCTIDQAKRRALYGSTPPLDEAFFAALEKLPSDTAGIALGVDRLVQCLLGRAALSEVLAFPHRTSL